MNKLISRNPILRFKLGKKIEKFLGGGLKTYGGLPIESIENKRGFYTLNGILYSVPVSLFDTSKDYKFMGTNIGGKVLAKENNFGDRLTDENKLKLLDSGFFKESDFSNVSAFQNALNHYFGKDGYGTIKVDNMWGNQTLKAFDFALGKANSPRVMGGISDPVITLAKLTPVSTPKITIPDQLPQINILVPQRTFNRSDIRQYIKGKGFDPYLFTGSQRKALRMVMNGTGTDKDLNIAKSMGVFKKGGILKFLNIRNLVK